MGEVGKGLFKIAAALVVGSGAEWVSARIGASPHLQEVNAFSTAMLGYVAMIVGEMYFDKRAKTKLRCEDCHL